jgi:peroxiredoxin
MAVEIGQLAPDFALPNTLARERLNLSDLRGKKVVFAWHVADFTGG